MKRLTAAAVALCALATTPAFSADLFGTPDTEIAAPAPVTEVGSNWYIRGDVGIGRESDSTVSPSTLLPTTTNIFTPGGSSSSDVGVIRGNDMIVQNNFVEVGLGYRYNDWLRFEGTYGYRAGAGGSTSQATQCPQSANQVSNYNGTAVATPVGYLWAPVACNGVMITNQHENLVMGNAYFDLGHYWGLTPYLGVGAGVNVDTLAGSTQFSNAAGTALTMTTPAIGSLPAQWVYNTGNLDATGHPIYANYTNANGVTFTGAQNWNRSFHSTQYSMAASFMAGFGYQITPSATVDFGYRLLDANVWGGSGRYVTNQLHIGIRYMAN